MLSGRGPRQWLLLPLLGWSSEASHETVRPRAALGFIDESFGLVPHVRQLLANVG
jgi:hypothetical protein